MSEHEPSIFDVEPDPLVEEKVWAEADADVAAGRSVPHAEVAKWLATWGTPDYKPMPDEWWK